MKEPGMRSPELRFDAVRLQLQQPGDGVFRETEWLTASWEQPEEFRRQLACHYAARAHIPLKSKPEAGYDFYYDLVLRHQAAVRPALLWSERELGLRPLTYSSLHSACTLRCTAWAAQGVRAGERLCVIAQSGPELLVPLLCGLRMGLVVSLLPPLGPDFLRPRLRSLPKARIATPRRYQATLRACAPSLDLLADEAAAAVPPGADSSSHTYAPGEPALALFSVLREPTQEPVSLSASAAYGGALRDAHLLFQLQPGEVIAAPEHALLQHQPALLLAALLAGATFLQTGVLDVEEAGALVQSPPHVLVVTARLRDAMLKLAPRPLPGLRLVVLDPQEEPAAQPWEDWTQRFSLQSTAAAAVLLDAAAGGSVLLSLRRPGRPPQLLQPTPGLPFSLLLPDGSGEPAQSGYGVWEPLPGSVGLLLSRRDGGYLYAGTLAPTRYGRCYPADEVEQTVISLPFVLGASVVPREDGRGVALLVFTGPEPLAEAAELRPARLAALRERIRVRLGEQMQPEIIELYAMFPRLRCGEVDHAWCARQYRSGLLRRREEHPLARLLDRLRAACSRPLWDEPASSPPEPMPPAAREIL